MLDLSSHIKIDAAALRSPNLCERFSPSDLDKIGIAVHEGYEMDKSSRAAWERRTEAAMDLALQVQKAKNFPWPNCANVTFPLVTIATMQFHSRAYPALISGTDIVKNRIIGDDPSGAKTLRARRISTYMSYQVTEEDSDWEEQHDRLLINLAVVGTAFIKTIRDSLHNCNDSILIPAKNLVLNYWARSVEDCPRKTEIVFYTRNEIHERILRGVFRDVRDADWYQAERPLSVDVRYSKSDMRSGLDQPETDETTPLRCLEQHVSFDLDGDGYAEPYVITIDSDTKQVLRIVTRFDREEDIERTSSGEIICIRSREYYTKYGFIPSPDGGIYDVGFGVLIGPLNESVNTLVNQLLDAGSLANAGGGFLGRGAKIRGGAYSFSPGEWKRVDSTGDDLRKSIVELPASQPSNVLLQLLSLLIDYTNRISGSTDMMIGENPGQNTPAQTAQTMVEQGSKIYTAIFKRVWRSMKEEFQKLYILDSIYMPIRRPFGQDGLVALREDFLGDPGEIVPVADPNITSDQQKIHQAILLKQTAMSTPGYDLEEVEHRFLTAIHVEGMEHLYPGKDKVPPLANPKIQVEQLKLQGMQMRIQAEQLMAAQKLESERRLIQAKIIELQAKAALEMEQAGGVKAGHDLEMFRLTLEAMKAHDESLGRQSQRLLEGVKNDQQHSIEQGKLRGMADTSSNQTSSPGS